ncbi:hypothetical protein [Bradyrhizobium forestalis]|uniref:hypothetical protein n=1 Tax=Bradyrhizobium forestalis TaxID=1419263 RepID=UPI0011AFD286|nr:hypothetical protein [Bradyrhizobium forestalis]
MKSQTGSDEDAMLTACREPASGKPSIQPLLLSKFPTVQDPLLPPPCDLSISYLMGRRVFHSRTVLFHSPSQGPVRRLSAFTCTTDEVTLD